MWVYWILFWWPALSALGIVQTRASASALKISMSALAIALALTIGLRFEVGVDWGNYLDHLDVAESFSFVEVLLGSDPAYGLLNWIAMGAGAGVWLVNLVSAIAFVAGLFIFCRRLPNPWLALTVAMPYMAIVMAMNYTRQAAAFGLVLWGLAHLRDGNVRRFLAFVIAATLFHKTAALLLPIAFLARSHSRIQTFVAVGVTTALAYFLFIAEHEVSLYEGYILERYASDGAAVRVLMNSAAAMVFLLARVLVDMPPSDKQFWTRFSLATLAFVPVLELSPSSTAVDRMALYFMPIQLVAFSYFPNVISRWGLRQFGILFVVGAYWLVMFVWFNYSNFYFAWLPYRFYPFEIL